MNSIIDAQEEYFSYQLIGSAPGMPVTLHTRSYFCPQRGMPVFTRDYTREELELEHWKACDRIYKSNSYTQLWDHKLQSDGISK